MKKSTIFFTVIFQFLFLIQLSSQSYDRFMLMWYDHSAQNTPIATMAQQYKIMQEHYFTSALVWFRLTHTAYCSPGCLNLLYASSQPSKAFMDSAYKYNIKIILTTPDNCLLRGAGSYGSNGAKGLAHWNGNRMLNINATGTQQTQRVDGANAWI